MKPDAKFRCWDSDDSEDEAIVIEAQDAESAAELFADLHGWGDFCKVTTRDCNDVVRAYRVDFGSTITRRVS